MSGGLGLAGRTVALLDSRTPFCLATVVYSGAAQRRMVAPGLKLIVLADGTVEGSFGSAELDEAVRGAAVEQLRREDIALVRLSPEGRRPARPAGPPPGRRRGAVVEVSLEPMLPPPRLIVVGAGHIAVPLVRYARILGFETTVIDDRERFANRERFPDADEIVVDDFRAAIARQEITPWTYLVLVTRGHEHDEATLRHVVDSPAPTSA